MSFFSLTDEELLKWAFPEDIWFHVDDLSSAHVYVRMHDGEKFESLPEAIIDDCAQLVKANSISGSKQPQVDVCYTPVTNLRKSGDMDVGQVGFHDMKLVRHVRNVRKVNETVKRLEKTREERVVNLREMHEEHERDKRQRERDNQREAKQREREEMERRKRVEEERSYSGLMKSDKMRSNQDGYESDEFM